jgi:aspartyl aminopeptidase
MEKVSNVNRIEEVIQHGVTAFHVVDYTRTCLKKAGFQELIYEKPWRVEQGQNYVMTPFPSMLVAIHVGAWTSQSAIRIAAAHTDAPCLKIKFAPELPGSYYTQMNVEPYGGLLKSTWFDRPLGIAGKLVLRGSDIFHPNTRLIASDRPVCIIPSLAPHMRKGSETAELNIQKEMMPIVGLQTLNEEKDADKSDFLMKYIQEEYEIAPAELLDYDLYLFNPELPEAVGMKQELISAPRIDNLASVAALLEAMEAEGQRIQEHSSQNSNIAIAAMFDNEEIGSRSKQGADSTILPQILTKLGRSLGIEEEEWQNRIARGFLLSMDGAQGYHPNYPETSDPTNAVYLGKGLVIKTSASQRYLSDSEASAVIKSLCEYKDIPWQQQVNRSGMPGGQTLGPILAAVLPIQGADVGIPMLAMHSARELAAYKDYQALAELAKVYYQYE